MEKSFQRPQLWANQWARNDFHQNQLLAGDRRDRSAIKQFDLRFDKVLLTKKKNPYRNRWSGVEVVGGGREQKWLRIRIAGVDAAFVNTFLVFLLIHDFLVERKSIRRVAPSLRLWSSAFAGVMTTGTRKTLEFGELSGSPTACMKPWSMFPSPDIIWQTFQPQPALGNS